MRHHAPMRACFIYLCVFGLLALQTGPASGHAGLSGSTPKDGARLDGPPSKVSVSYAEPPTNDSIFTVMDGCGDDVSASVEILNDTIEASLDEGQPGKWAVRWNVISAVDGHATKEGIKFEVAGTADCSQAAPDGGDSPTPTPESSVPIVPIAVATALILVVAVAIRLRSRTSTDTE